MTSLSIPTVLRKAAKLLRNNKDPLPLFWAVPTHVLDLKFFLIKVSANIFVVRVAGNAAGQLEIDSIDYAALQLGSSVIMVLGHENCGAVTAVVKHQTNGIEAIARLIQPAVKGREEQMPGNQTEIAIKANVRLVMS